MKEKEIQEKDKREGRKEKVNKYERKKRRR